MRFDNFWKVIAVLIVIAIYLFALNGRYEFSDNSIHDKWTKKSMRHYTRSLDFEKWEDDE